MALSEKTFTAKWNTPNKRNAQSKMNDKLTPLMNHVDWSVWTRVHNIVNAYFVWLSGNSIKFNGHSVTKTKTAVHVNIFNWSELNWAFAAQVINNHCQNSNHTLSDIFLFFLVQFRGIKKHHKIHATHLKLLMFFLHFFFLCSPVNEWMHVSACQIVPFERG